MILLFMGHLPEASTVIEQALESLQRQQRRVRLAARAAGQDAGVADMALMSWCLWLLGAVDTAAARVAEAITRAEAIGHSHSLAYACYYASVVHALRGEPAIALKHAERVPGLVRGTRLPSVARIVTRRSRHLH